MADKSSAQVKHRKVEDGYDSKEFEGHVPYSEERKKTLWRLAKSWINNCRLHHTHSSCVPVSGSEDGYCLTHLLEVGGSHLRLVERTDFPGRSIKSEYTTLSYCWGKTMPLSVQTTALTLPDHKKAIDLETLPRTLRDAVEIARNIDIPCLWIDALFIIQGCSEDWEREAAAMAEIYSRSVVTIAAANSDHYNGGCLWTERNPGFPKVSYWHDAFETGNILSSRWWAMQEGELSPQILYFTITQALWECRLDRFSKYLPHKLDPTRRPYIYSY